MRLRFDHVRVNVGNLSRSIEFYRSVFGYEKIIQYDTPLAQIVLLGHDSMTPGIELWRMPEAAVTPTPDSHLAYSVDDVHAAVCLAAEHGAMIWEAIRRQGDETVGIVADPDGNLIEFNDFVGRGVGERGMP